MICFLYCVIALFSFSFVCFSLKYFVLEVNYLSVSYFSFILFLYFYVKTGSSPVPFHIPFFIIHTVITCVLYFSYIPSFLSPFMSTFMIKWPVLRRGSKWRLSVSRRKLHPCPHSQHYYSAHACLPRLAPPPAGPDTLEEINVCIPVGLGAAARLVQNPKSHLICAVGRTSSYTPASASPRAQDSGV